MKLMAAVVLAGGFIAAPLAVAPSAAALPPGNCDGADCVTYIDRTATLGAPCVPGSRYVFGLDSSGATLLCASTRTWEQSPPLVGMRTLRSQCGNATGVAQTPDGQPLSCIGGAWSSDYSRIYY